MKQENNIPPIKLEGFTGGDLWDDFHPSVAPAVREVYSSQIESFEFATNRNSVEHDYMLVIDAMFDLFKRKNNDYGNSFMKPFQDYGVASLMIRILDKTNRLVSLTKNQNKPLVNDESLRDTFIDLANYCILSIICLQNKEKNEAD